jgi:Putative Tad-like Flp pilus-assembly
VPAISTTRRSPSASHAGLMLLLAAATVFAIYTCVIVVADAQGRAAAQAKIQSAANAAAVGSAAVLPKGTVAVVQAACRILESQKARGSYWRGGQHEVQIGHWDAIGQSFSASGAKPNAVRITIRLRSEPRPFAILADVSEQQIEAQAIAVLEPLGNSLVAETSTRSTAIR